MAERDLIDLREVARMLGGMHPEHVRGRLLKRPDFPRPFRISGRVLLDREEIQGWIEMQRQPINERTTQKSRNEVLRSAAIGSMVLGGHHFHAGPPRAGFFVPVRSGSLPAD